MMPVTDFLSCTEPLDEFESLSYHQTHHAKTYATGLAAASSILENRATWLIHADPYRCTDCFTLRSL
jgi:hypothetical protein